MTDAAAKELIRLTDSRGQLVPFTTNWKKNTRSIQINPTMQLVGNQTYVVEFKPKTVIDTANNVNGYFRSTLTTENYPIVIQPPLPMPIIEPEAAIQSSPSPIAQTNTSTTATVSSTETVSFGEEVTTPSDATLTDAINESQSDDKITLQADSTDTKIALSFSQVNRLGTIGKLLEVKISEVTFKVTPNSLKIGDPTVSHILLGAEVVNDSVKNNLISKANNREKFIVMGKDIYHLSVSAITKEKTERAAGYFNEKISVSLPIPEMVKSVAAKGLLKVGRFNEITNSWDEVAGQFDLATGRYLFETEKFSNWTIMLPVRSFTDTVGHWANKEIEYMASNGMINGIGYGQFSPDTPIKRAEFVAILVNLIEFE
ncbi:S-layer homology domain-containing protein [Effusibacillus consociatus]|uniref:S-layer homology domain-containing protein n=1 Tax=Effusibacillus consociatus TaxID=1117041 RepID=A0ABV9Q658_9BACL